MKVQELTDALRNISEDSIKKLKLESWISLELARIVNRRNYWWRKANLSFSSVAGQALYDLIAGGANAIAGDFYQMASPLYQFDGKGGKIAELPYVSDSQGILAMQASTTSGTPTLFTLEPGKANKTLRLTPIPGALIPYSGLYYRAAIINWNTPNMDDIPVVPPEFHYVVYQALERRIFFYMYGQKDPRAVIAAAAEKECLADLDGYKAGSTLVAPEWRSGDCRDFVQSTT